MAGRVRVGTAYIDIKLGSFQEFKQAAEARARETAKNIAKRMTEEINKGVSGKQAGTKIGDEVATNSTKAFSKIRSAWNNELGLTGKQASKSFLQSFSSGFQGLGNGYFSFFSKAMGNAALSGVTLAGKAFNGIKPIVSGVGTAVGKLTPIFQKIGEGVQGVATRAGSALSSISKGFEGFGRKVGFASFMVQGLGYDLTFLATGPVVALTAGLGYFGLKAAADLEQARASLAPFVGGLKSAGDEIDILAKIAANSPAFDTIHIVEYAKSLLAAGLTVDKTNKLFNASSNIFTTLGLSVDQANGAFYAITQIMQKGTAQSEELSQQLAERGVPIWKILADSMGKTQAQMKDLVKQGKVTSVQFVDAMIKAGSSGIYLNGAGVAADTIKAKFANLKEQVQYKLAVAFEKNLFPVLSALFDKYGPRVVGMFSNMDGTLQKVAKGIQGFADRVDHLKARWDALSDSQKDNAKKFAELLIAAGPTILLFTKIGSAIAALGTVAALLTTPVGIVLGLLGLLAGALYLVRKPLEAYFKSVDGGKGIIQTFKDNMKGFVDFVRTDVVPVLKTLGEIVGAALLGFITGKQDLHGIAGEFATLRVYINGVVKELKDSLGPAWEQLKGSLKDLGINLDDKKTRMKLFFSAVIAIVGTIALVIALIVGAITAAITLFAGLFRVITDIVVGAFHVIAGLFFFFKDLLDGSWGKLAGDLTQIWNGLWMLIVGTIWDAISGIIKAVTNLVKPIVDLFKWMYDILVGHSIVPDLVKAIAAWFASLPGRVLGVLSGMVNTVVGYFSDLARRAVGAVQNLANEVAAKVQGVGNAVAHAASGFGSLLVNSGREIIDGLINGIESKLSALRAKLSSIASTIAGFFPGSPVKEGPLRVLNNGHVGATIVQMIADGMADTSSLKLAATSAATAALPDMNAAAQAGYSGGTLAPGTAGGIVINQTVNVPTAIPSPQEMADYSTRRLVSALTTKATQ
jgi:tape measure domain-containing protein